MLARITVAALAALSLLASGVSAKMSSRQSKVLAERASMMQPNHLEKRQASNSTWRYLNNNTQPFKVTSPLPGIDYDWGEMYSGTLPIGTSNRSLFFVYIPKVDQPSTDLTIWLNGKQRLKQRLKQGANVIRRTWLQLS
jgi:carboxypeptidase D